MRNLMLALLIAAVAGTAGCAAAVGAGAAGGAYEYQNKKALDQLDQDFKSGKISRSEYERRKQAIDKRSLVY